MDKDDGSTVGGCQPTRCDRRASWQAGLALHDLHVFGNIRRRHLMRVVARVEFLDQREAAAQLAQSEGAGGGHDHEAARHHQKIELAAP
jgi:hypothetical protein